LTNNRFWEEVGPYTYLRDLKRSGIATYFWGNWHDEPTAQIIEWHANLGGRLLLGPGNHCVPPPDFNFAGEVRHFFDEHVKHEAPAQPEPAVTWWLEDAAADRHWQRSAEWPGVDAKTTAWYLAAGSSGAATAGELRPTTAAAARSEFMVDYGVGSAEYFAFWVDSQHGRGLSFTSPALITAEELIGYSVVHLRVTADQSEPLLFAYLEQLAPDDTAQVIAFGRLAAAYRNTGTAPYATLGLPWHTGMRADYAPLKPGNEVTLSFALTPTARVLPPGHRLRLVITGADPRQRNLEQIRLDPPPLIAVSLGGRSGSRIELPLRPHAAAVESSVAAAGAAR
jgi:uncharacterized protein